MLHNLEQLVYSLIISIVSTIITVIFYPDPNMYMCVFFVCMHDCMSVCLYVCMHSCKYVYMLGLGYVQGIRYVPNTLYILLG